MFKFLKKNKKSDSSDVQSIFPRAEDILEKTSFNWRTLDAEEILRKINIESSDGKRCAYFFGANISDLTYKELCKKNYKVSTFTCDDGNPGVCIKW